MHFEMDEFLDHTQSAKPTIFISPNEIYSTHSLVVKDIDRIVRRFSLHESGLSNAG